MTEITDRDPQEMAHDELRSEWEVTYERTEFGPLDDEEREEIWDRRQALWDELEARADVDQPECPECGAQEWAQSVGDPKHCVGCGFMLAARHEDLIDEINQAWSQIQAGGEGSA